MLVDDSHLSCDIKTPFIFVEFTYQGGLTTHGSWLTVTTVNHFQEDHSNYKLQQTSRLLVCVTAMPQNVVLRSYNVLLDSCLN